MPEVFSTHLDIAYQAELFPMIDRWLAQGRRSVLSVVRDLSLARRYGNRARVLFRGQVLASGEKEVVFAPEVINRAYDRDMAAWVRALPDSPPKGSATPWNPNLTAAGLSACGLQIK